MAREGMGSVIGIAAVAGLAYWAYSSGMLSSLLGSSAPAPQPPANPASGAGTTPVVKNIPDPPPAPPTCAPAGILVPLLADVQRAQGAAGSTFGSGLPGTLTIDQWDWYMNQRCSGMADQYKLTADDLFPGDANRGGPLNWLAFSGAAQQKGLSGPRRIARVTRGQIMRRIA